jgi:hypothetical protein
VNFLVLVLAFQYQVRGLLTRDLLVSVLRIVGASAVMAAAVWAVTSRMEMLPGEGTTFFALKAFVPILAGLPVYFAAARLFRIDEAKTLLRRFRH